MNNVLEIRNLNKLYSAFSLKDVSFNVPAGYIMGFIGRNGAGKTTTIKSVLNMINYESGKIKIFGSNSKDSAEQVDGRIGVVMDAPFYVEDWTIADVEKSISPFYQYWDGDKYWGLITRFDIAFAIVFVTAQNIFGNGLMIFLTSAVEWIAANAILTAALAIISWLVIMTISYQASLSYYKKRDF